MAGSDVNAGFNPFSDDGLVDDTPEFSNARIVLSDTDAEFDMTQYHISIDDHLQSISLAETPVSENAIIVEQPTLEPPTNRRQIPVYTVGWTSTNGPQMLPITGLDFLTGVHEIALQQTVTNFDGSAKRYIIKIPNGETLYHSSENSTELCRLCCGSQRSFEMSILDHTQQEAARFVRTSGFACGFPALQELRVYSPDRFLGRIRQDFGISAISFTVSNKIGKNLFRIFGPDTCGCCIPLDAKFSIAGETGGGRLGQLIRRWNNSLCDYNLMLSFPAAGTPNDHKILLIGAAMLIEYMFFEHRKTFCIRPC